MPTLSFFSIIILNLAIKCWINSPHSNIKIHVLNHSLYQLLEVTKIVIILLITVEKNAVTPTFHIMSKFHRQSCYMAPLRGDSELTQVLLTQWHIGSVILRTCTQLSLLNMTTESYSIFSSTSFQMISICFRLKGSLGSLSGMGQSA